MWARNCRFTLQKLCHVTHVLNHLRLVASSFVIFSSYKNFLLLVYFFSVGFSKKKIIQTVYTIIASFVYGVIKIKE